MDNIFNLEEAEPAAQSYDNISKMRPSFAWLDGLNPQQKEAVMTTEGPLLVLSGAGTGKTRVLTTRLAYILANMKANPWNCLVVTFTNRAAKEMGERARQMIGDVVSAVWLGTFHGICVKILRANIELVGLKPHFTILDEDDQKRMIKQILNDEGIDEKKYTPQLIVDHIARWKDRGLTFEKVKNSVHENTSVKIYGIYQERLRSANCVDFGDILLYTLEILMKNPDVQEYYQQKFKYIMVDEYQDTNVTQYLLLRLLAQKSRNLCCVGDDDQSIYSWRGAEIENILRFSKDFEDAKIIRLEQNYRSTANILSAASSLIAHNSSRLGKTLRVADSSPAKKCDNEKIRLISTYSGQDEAKFVLEEIENLHRSGTKYSDMAILVRTAFQTREFEEIFIKEAIPYQVIGGPKFYERAEIRDALAYFRVISQPDDNLALERIINKPTRGIGKKTIDKIRQYAYANTISMYNAAQKMVENGALSGKSAASIKTVIDNFEQWRKQLETMPLGDFASMVIDESGYLEMLKAEQTEDAAGRIENLRELVNVMSDTAQYKNMDEFLEHVSLVMDNDNNFDDNKVMLITLHSAKGLEFDVVFLPGWEEGLFPHQRSLEEGGSNSLEEERRLAYVAITRAKKKLYILSAMSRRIYGQWQNNIPSRFINEIPSDTIKISNGSHTFAPQAQRGYGGYVDETYGGYTQNRRSSYTPSYSQPATTQKKSRYIGVRVYHETYGYGKIVAVSGQTCEVLFDDGSKKKILGSYLQKVD